RPRSPGDKNPYLLHMLVLPSSGAVVGRFEAARDVFVGRGRTPEAPAALDPGKRGDGRVGATLDPILSLSAELELSPRGTVQLAFVTLLAETREAALALADRHRSLSDLEWTQDRARERCEEELAEADLLPRALPTLARLLALLLHPTPGLRAPAEVLAKNA